MKACKHWKWIFVRNLITDHPTQTHWSHIESTPTKVGPIVVHRLLACMAATVWCHGWSILAKALSILSNGIQWQQVFTHSGQRCVHARGGYILGRGWYWLAVTSVDTCDRPTSICADGIPRDESDHEQEVVLWGGHWKEKHRSSKLHWYQIQLQTRVGITSKPVCKYWGHVHIGKKDRGK